MTEHEIRYIGTHGHNGEDWHECKRCGRRDWIAHYGEYRQLNFYYEPCIPKQVEWKQLELF